MKIYVILQHSEGYAGRDLEEFHDVCTNEVALINELRRLSSIGQYSCVVCDDIGVRMYYLNIAESVRLRKPVPA